MCSEEQKAQEQKEREEQRAAREAEARGPPFRDQIVACEQLLLWCRQYTGKADSAAKENNGAARGPAELDGLVAFSKKTVEGDGDVFATSRSKSAPRCALCMQSLRPLARLAVLCVATTG